MHSAAESRILRDLFNGPGDFPNYFILGFGAFFTSPTKLFPGLSHGTLFRPPSFLPPSVHNKTFADLLHILKGYPVDIRNEEHRAKLLRDARYFHLKGLEQELIPHSISYNLAHEVTEIVIRLEDIRQSGVSFVADSLPTAASKPQSIANNTTTHPSNSAGWAYYQRPYVDSEAYSLIVEISGEESTSLALPIRAADGINATKACFGHAQFHGQTLSRIASLFDTVADKINLSISQPLGNISISDERVKVRIGSDADVVVDAGNDKDEMLDPAKSERMMGIRSAGAERQKDVDLEQQAESWVLKRAHWRLRAQPLAGDGGMAKSGFEIILDAVKIEAYRSERGRNQGRGFLM